MPMPTTAPSQDPQPFQAPAAPLPAAVPSADRAIVDELLADGRLSNAELARRVGLPESTCSGRVRALRETGILRGVHADVDLARLGRPIEAMVAVRFTGHARDDIDGFRAHVQRLPGVIAAYHVAGENDFLVHVCSRDPHELRDLVLDSLTVLPGVAHAETSLIFDRVAGIDPLG